MRARFVSALLACAGLPAAAQADQITAGGAIEARLGYGSNPFLQIDSPGGTGQGGATLSGFLDRRTEATDSKLTGAASIDQYFQNFGKAENYVVALSHSQTFSPRLTGTASVSYQDSINPQNFSDYGGSNVDLLSIGQRTHRLTASGMLNWQATTRDSFYIGPDFTHTTYPGSIGSNFDDYGLRGGYLRQINERLKVGVDLGYQRLNSQLYPDSTSYTANLRLVYDLNQIWQFDGTVGLIHQATSGFGSSNTIGFSGQMCGKYPSDHVCAQFSRQSAPSGFGGLRTDNRFALTYGHNFSSRSRIDASATYDISDSRGLSIIPKQKFWELSAGYSRDVSRRISAGVSGRYQHRDYGRILNLADTSVSGYSATLNASYKFGHID